MSKINCNIIQDILPLYVDDVVSEDTKNIVEEHLTGCDECKKIAESMQEKIEIKTDETDNKFKKTIKNINSSTHIHIIHQITLLTYVHLNLDQYK